MSDFCDFVPDDPSCQTTPEPDVIAPGPDGGDGGDNGGDGGDMGGDMSKGDMSHGDHSGKDGDMTWEKFDEMASEYFHPMDGNIAYLMVAGGAVMELVLDGFIWHEDNADTVSQLASGSSNTDYYSLMHKIELYGGLAIFGTATLTQLLATFGIMVSINMLVWGMVLPLGGMILELSMAVLGFLAYNQFYD
jgi:hypothetical protein